MFVVGCTNDQERDGSQVSDEKVERMLRARLLLGCVLCDVLCVELIPSLVGCPAFPFIDQGGAGVTDGRKKKNQRPRRSFEGVGSSFSSELAPLTWQMVPGIAHSLILIGSCFGFVQQVVTSHPVPACGVAHQDAEP